MSVAEERRSEGRQRSWESGTRARATGVFCGECGNANPAHARFCSRCGVALPVPLYDPADPLIGRVLGDRYLLLRLLGEGAASRVYLAEQRTGKAAPDVAVKVLREDLGHEEQVVRRFRLECETVMAIGHPNVIRFHDVGELRDGTPYVVMEYVQGGTLADETSREGPMEVARAQHIVWQICGALQDAHRRRIVHRDLKPQNILLEPGDFVKVTDFGVAKRLWERRLLRLTEPGMLLGTPPYMSPEHFSKVGAVDPRSDIYALGVIAYELLTGCLPFEGDSALQWAAHHISSMPVPIERQLRGRRAPATVLATVMQALAKDPADRPQTAIDFARGFVGAPHPLWIEERARRLR